MIKLILIIIYVFLFFILWILIEAQIYRIRSVEIKNKKIPKKFNNFKIVFISDIHYGKYFRIRRLEQIIKTINKLEADIIIIGGDYLDNPVKNKKHLSEYLDSEFKVLRKLKAKLGVFTVLGNHDYFEKQQLLLNKINDSSFKVLQNKRQLINIGKESIELKGLDDLVKGNSDVMILSENSNNFTIAISHNPDFFSDYKNMINYDLGLSGHTHGGQMTFLGLYAPHTSSKYGQRYVKKIVHEKNRDILVTNGIGNGTLPIRFFATPEIVQINLKH